METPILILSLSFYFIAAVLCFFKKSSEKIFLSVMAVAIVLHLIAMIIRSVAVLHPPFTNLYETFLLLSFLLALRLVFWKRQFPKNLRWLILAIIYLFLLTALVMPTSYKMPKPLMPALNSAWMYIHVPSYFFGYMALILGFIYAATLLVHRWKNPERDDLSLVNRMDTEIKIAFLFLNIGLVTGGIWAYRSWGNYWAWDPKETWALINIFIMAFYFHLDKPTVTRKAVLVILVLLSVIFTYLGVTFIFSGLHSYA
ncbi:MAG: cytochrome c biogenesis protein CcsA [Candidatus Marinimicrobia bacterium]|nr:cytochrome c biogenesis protein CcsA [Candidatus Neomarinimicrobiota bacterium]